jgi:hypothetical protein
MRYIDILRNRIEEQKKSVGGEGVVAMTCNEVLGLIQAIESSQENMRADVCPQCGVSGESLCLACGARR